MNKERLQELINLLKTVPKEKFDLNVWTDDIVKPNTIPSECGTVCCAIGFAMQHKPFNDLGFLPDPVGTYTQYSSTPSYNELREWKAVAAFFNITVKESFYLFDKWEYDEPTLENVIDRIRQFITDNPI